MNLDDNNNRSDTVIEEKKNLDTTVNSLVTGQELIT